MMRKLLPVVFALLIVLNTFHANAQLNRATNVIHFKSQSLDAPQNVGQMNALIYDQDEVFENGIIRVLQFSKLPDAAAKTELTALGVHLIDYIPNRAFIAHLATNVSVASLLQLHVSSVVPFEGYLKTDNFLSGMDLPEFAIQNGNEVKVLVTAYHFVDFAKVKQHLISSGYDIQEENSERKTLEFFVAKSDIAKLTAVNEIKFVEVAQGVGEPENYTARTLHRANALNTKYQGGLKYDGTGITVMMQDDGDIGPHIDFNGRVNQASANSTSSFQGDHGDHVAGTFMGAGNIDPEAEGMAPGVFGFIYGNFNSNYNVVPSLVSNNDLTITTKSYSNGCNAGYTSLTLQLDQQVRQQSQLLHVFSAGNSGTSNCGYGAGNVWGNITGGHKIGKNVIAVANLNANDQVATSSSRGPANDGRIKPDISAKGSNVYSTIENYTYGNKSGTSMACPGVTGTIAQLYHAYKDHNNGQNPNSGLMKAIVLNTAEDLGNPGPDFIHGWGRINAYRAYKTIENNTYLSGTISSTGDSTSHTLTIPAGVSEAKIMLYWLDFEASMASQFALVNDLDFKVEDPSSAVNLPLVLNSTPSASALNTPASPGVDNLNNMEQVVLNNPAAGTYTLKVGGTSVPQGAQEYFIVYQFTDENVKVTFPIGGESLVPNRANIIRWDANGNSTPFSVAYSLDSGLTWTSIANNVSGSARQLNWSSPNAFSDKALIRVSRGANESISEATFTIMAVPTNVQVISSCTDSAQLSWNPVIGADGYVIRKLGTSYMDSIGFSTNTSTYVSGVLANDPDVWLSVEGVKLNSAGTEITANGWRTIAIRKQTGIFNCPSEAPIADFSVVGDGFCVGGTVQLLNESENSLGTYSWSFSPNTVTFVNGTNANSENPEVQFNSDDSYTVTLVATNPGASDTETKVGFVQPTYPDQSLSQSFGLPNFLPNGWEIISSGGASEWEISNITNGTNGSITNAAYFDRFNDERINAEDYLISAPVDLSSFSNAILVFDVAHSIRQMTTPAVSGGLRVDISTDCGFSFQPTGYDESSIDLATVSSFQTSLWTPSGAGDWRSDSVSLAGLGANGTVKIRFANLAGIRGNSLFIDNIRIVNSISGLSTSNKIDYKLYPNPTEGTFHVSSSNFGAGSYNLEVFDMQGKMVHNESSFNENESLLLNVDLKNMPSGLYTVKISNSKSTLIEKLSVVKQNR